MSSKQLTKSEKETLHEMAEEGRPVVSVHDKKRGVYYEPIIYKSITDAIRSTAIMMTDKRLMISSYPADFELVEIAKWYKTGTMLLINEKIVDLNKIERIKTME